MLLSLGILLLAAMSGDKPKDPITRFPGGWDLYRNSTDCSLARDYEGGTFLRLGYRADTQAVTVAIHDPGLAGVVNGASYRFRLVFANPSDRGPEIIGTAYGFIITTPRGGSGDWGKIPVKGFATDAGLRGYVFVLKSKTFFYDAGRKDLFGLMDGKRVVESLKLDQVRPALDVLKECSENMVSGGR